MEYVSGIIMMVRNAGSASVKSLNLIWTMSTIMNEPMRMSAGAVA